MKMKKTRTRMAMRSEPSSHVTSDLLSALGVGLQHSISDGSIARALLCILGVTWERSCILATASSIISERSSLPCTALRQNSIT